MVSLVTAAHSVDEIVRQDPKAIPRCELEVVAARQGEAEVLPPPTRVEVELRVSESTEPIELCPGEAVGSDDGAVLVERPPVHLGQDPPLTEVFVQLRARIGGKDVELRP